MTHTALAVDLGSASGRIIAGTWTGERIEQTEIHRFAHEAREMDGYLTWDVERIHREIVTGLRRAIEQFPTASSVSVDTWGVDWAPLDEEGNLVVTPRAYRDQRTVRTLDAFRERLSDEDVWMATGISPATINTANQLFAFVVEEPEAARRTAQMLFLPDYFAYRLTGQRGWSRSIASTGALCTPGATRWADAVFEALKLPRDLVGELTAEHSVVGPCTVPGLEQLTVVRAGAHDSACAVQAMLGGSENSYFLSSGSWSVLGVVRGEPLMAPEALCMGVTNEARADHGVRPLFNITGLWILQECQRQWRAEGSASDITTLLDAARTAPPGRWSIDVDDPTFAQPGHMVQRIESSLGVTALTQGDIVRVICESLAQRYASGLASLGSLTGSPAFTLGVVGGGSRNALLCQLTADAIGIPVEAGPAEASVLGSLIAQCEIHGWLDGVPRDQVIRRSADTTRYVPAHA